MDWLTDNSVMRQFVRPALDILLLSFLVYKSWNILVQTRAVQVVKGAAIMVLIYILAFFLRLDTLLLILNLLFPGILIAIAIIFQPELRRIFTRIGQGEWFRFSARTRAYHLESVVNSVEVMSSKRLGCLVVLARSTGLKNIVETGTRINADLSASLLLTLFSHGTPLHDGATIISADKIVAAGCFLPLSEQADIRRSFGTRHRAALGLAEESDAVVVVVSEENGAISLAYDANLLYDLPIDEIADRVRALMEVRREPVEEAVSAEE